MIAKRVIAALSLGAMAASPAHAQGVSIERGRYVALIGGCNDCHTAGYAQAGGKAPMTEWLKGVPIGNQGPWGTTYPTNLRLLMQGLTEDQWLAHGKALETRPPMPWFNIRAMTENDLRSLYRFIRALPGTAGEPAPAYVAVADTPKTPVVVMVPQPPK